MKHILFVACLALFAGCAKKYNTDTENSGIVGKWKLTETYSSDGARGSWTPYTAAPVIVEFTNSGEVNYTPNLPKASLKFDRYSLSGNQLNMSSTQNSNIDIWPVHSMTSTKLELSIYMCFEGCAYRFKAVK